VIENLINNAIHYSSAKDNSEPQKKIVEIKLNKRGKNIYLEIQDYGIGIPEEDKKFIFEKFFRSKNVSKHQTRGSGLGLFIAKSIVKKMNGKIGFQSKQNQGTTFWFTLPIKKLKLET
jgi:signal transduction histidine kinase